MAVDFAGRCYVYRQYNETRLIVSEAASAAISLTPARERIEYTIAPPDMWSTQKDTGKTMAQIFGECGLPVLKAANNRVQGFMAVKEMLKPLPDGKPGLMICESCKSLIDDLQAIQHDEKNPNDCAKQPHELTHDVDALRYFCVMRTLKPEKPVEVDDYEEDRLDDYDEYMTGGAPSASYIGY